jgi:hypothetical protein
LVASSQGGGNTKLHRGYFGFLTMPSKSFVPWGTKQGTLKNKKTWVRQWAKSKLANVVKGWKARRQYKNVPWSVKKEHRDRAWVHTRTGIWTMTNSQRAKKNYYETMKKRRRF